MHNRPQRRHPGCRPEDASERPLHLPDLVVVGRQHERLTGEHERGDHEQATTEAEHAEAREHEDLSQHADDARQEEHHLQPAGGAVQVLAPEIDDERHERHKPAESHAWGLEFDVQPGSTDQEQEPREAWAGQRVEQFLGPARLRQGHAALESVGLPQSG